MKTYKYQPEKKSRIFDSSLKASNQLPLSTILLKYGEKMEGGGKSQQDTDNKWSDTKRIK